MALIFTFPHLDSTGKGRTPGSYSSSASTVVEIKRGVLLSGAPAGGEFLGRRVCFRAAPEPPPLRARRNQGRGWATTLKGATAGQVEMPTRKRLETKHSSPRFRCSPWMGHWSLELQA